MSAEVDVQMVVIREQLGTLTVRMPPGYFFTATGTRTPGELRTALDEADHDLIVWDPPEDPELLV